MPKKKIEILPPSEDYDNGIILPESKRACPNLFTPVLVDTPTTFQELKREAENCVICAVDTETTGLCLFKDKIIGVCISVPPWEKGWYIPFYNSPEGTIWYNSKKTFDERLAFVKLLLESDIPKIFQNALYDIPMFYFNWKIVTRALKADTLLASHVIDPDSEHGLKELSVTHIHPEADWYESEMHRYNHAVGGTKENPKYWLIPINKVAAYGGADAVFTGRIYDWSMKTLVPSLRKVFNEIAMPLTKELIEMRVTGFKVDREYLQRGEQWYTALLYSIREKICLRANDPEFNPSSPDQLRELFFNKLMLPPGRKSKKGYSTDEDELKRLKSYHPIVNMILDYREAEKLKSTYFSGLLEDSTEDGVFYPDVKQHGTRTGRISIGRLHQIPHGSLVRQAFVAREGCVLASGDQSQIEARVLAHYSQDPALLKIYRDGKDIHDATTKSMFNLPCDVDEVKKLYPEERRRGKSIGFALLYLESVYGLARQLECSVNEAKGYYERFFQIYKGIQPWAQKELANISSKGYVEMLLGRRRYLPDLKDAPMHKPVWPRQRPWCFGKSKRFGGLGLSLELDLALSTKEWTRNKAADIRSILKDAGRKECSTCPVLFECYYLIEYKRLQHFVEHSQRQGLNCVSDDVEMLTAGGWKRCDELTIGENVFSVNPNGSIYLARLKAITITQVTNMRMFSIESNQISVLATENHRWLIDRVRRIPTRHYTTQFKQSDELQLSGADRIWTVADQPFETTSATWTDDEVRLLGWVLTDGYYKRQFSKKGKECGFGRVVVTQSKPRYLGEIENLFQRLGKHSHHVTNDEHFWGITSPKTYEIRTMMPAKTLTATVLKQLSTLQRHLLFETMLKGDGTWSEKLGRFVSFFAGTKERADVFLMLCALNAQPATAYMRDMSRYRPYSPKLYNIPKMGIYWEVHLGVRRKSQPGFGGGWINNWCGRVWCPTVEDGAWIAKRNGKVFITGNSLIQGSAADLTSMGIIRTGQEIKKHDYPATLLNYVHDEVIYELPADSNVDLFLKEFQKQMESVNEYLSVPLVFKPMAAKNWAELK